MDETKLRTLNFIYAYDEPLLHYIIPALVNGAFPNYIINCKVVDNGKKLLEEITSTKNLDGVITDHSMPKKTGSQALLEARASGYLARAIIISGCINEALLQDAMALANVPILQKPFGPGEFLATLRKYWPEYAPKQP